MMYFDMYILLTDKDMRQVAIVDFLYMVFIDVILYRQADKIISYRIFTKKEAKKTSFGKIQTRFFVLAGIGNLFTLVN